MSDGEKTPPDVCGEPSRKDLAAPPLAPAALAFGASQFLLHGWALASMRDPRMLLMHGVAFIYDLFLLATAVVALEGLCRATPKRWRRTAELGARGILFAVGLVLTSYPLILAEFLCFPVNVFSVDLGVTGFFLTHILGWRGAGLMVGAAALAILSLRHPFSVSIPRRRWLLGGLAVLCLSGAVLGLMGRGPISIQPNPLIYSGQEILRDWFTRGRRVVPRPTRPVAPQGPAVAPLDPSPLEAAVDFRYDHVLLLAMETVNESQFAPFVLGRKDGFCEALRDRAAYFRHYYATNLDSYTSLIAMLTSVQVPYRAYEMPEFFDPVNGAPNMIGALAGKGWSSLFLCTAEYLPFVPVHDFWSATISGRYLPGKERWVSVGQNLVEAGTEDKAAIPSILSFMKAHPRTVIMQEMVFGHSPRWKMLTGKGQLEYYDEFFRELHEETVKAGLAERTLFVIVADHGERKDSAVAENYHVPLLLVGQKVEPCVQDGMFCHLDLQQIVGHYLCGLPEPRPREQVLVIGHSGRWVYGQIALGGRQIFLDALDGTVLSRQGDLPVHDVFARFQAAVDFFARFQRTR